MAQIRSTIKIEMEHSKQSWTDMFKTKGMRRRVFIAAFLGIFTQMSGNTLLSYYQNLLFELMGYTTIFAKTRINIANQCWGLMNAVFIALVVTRFPRRYMFMLSAFAMSMAFMGMTITFHSMEVASQAKTKNRSAQIASLFFFFAFSPCYNIGNNSLTYTYLVELFPFAQRTMGIGIQQIFGKAAGFFNLNVNPIAMRAISWKYMAIYCGWLIFELIFVYLFYPETYGRTLEELAFCKFHTVCGYRSSLILKQCSRTRSAVRRLFVLLRSRSMVLTTIPRTLRKRMRLGLLSVPSKLTVSHL
jgi:hypothetical protein